VLCRGQIDTLELPIFPSNRAAGCSLLDSGRVALPTAIEQ